MIAKSSIRKRSIYLAGIVFASFALSACEKPAETEPAAAVEQAESAVAETVAQPVVDAGSATQLATVLDSLSDEHKARYQYRNPQQTLEFFDIEPGMKVGEVLPGNNGWYTQVLLPYLGSEGLLVGIDYPSKLWSNFGFMTPEKIEEKKTWAADWIAATQKLAGENAPSINAYPLEAMPESMAGTLDAVLFFRALHNLARFNESGGFLDNAIAETYAALKPGGIVGVVQHQAREDRPDAWANGNAGYLKSSFVKQKMLAAGFEFIAQSDINANPKDTADEGDVVWRLAPARAGYKEGTPEAAAIDAIGESNRMTLKFRKPL